MIAASWYIQRVSPHPSFRGSQTWVASFGKYCQCLRTVLEPEELLTSLSAPASLFVFEKSFVLLAFKLFHVIEYS